MSFTPIVHVVAFDGQVVDTLPLRGRALEEAIASVAGDTIGHAGSGSAGSATTGSETSKRAIDDWTRHPIAGRDFAEAARSILERQGHEPAVPELALETLVDLVALDAGRRYSASLSHGVALASGAAELLAELQRSGRVVARADSARRDVSAILALGALDHEFTFIRCSDDAPRLPGRSTRESSMAAISTRVQPAGALRDASPIYHP